jgi:diadenosine tetraphosphate (Ap4A) HIT family hydrolase
MESVVGCLACDLTSGRQALPGGRVHETTHWIVEHCVGPLGLGVLLVKPMRHVLSVGELTTEEARELGPLLQQCAAIVDELIAPEQVYVALWSHAGRTRVHIHFVIQPATTEAIDHVGGYGPHMQAKMFELGVMPPSDEVDVFSERARAAFART